MFASHLTVTGTQYTGTVALLIVALIFSPAVLLVSPLFGYVPFSVAFACSALCVVMAWVNWKKYSVLTIPSIATPYVRGK